MFIESISSSFFSWRIDIDELYSLTYRGLICLVICQTLHVSKLVISVRYELSFSLTSDSLFCDEE